MFDNTQLRALRRSERRWRNITNKSFADIPNPRSKDIKRRPASFRAGLRWCWSERYRLGLTDGYCRHPAQARPDGADTEPISYPHLRASFAGAEGRDIERVQC